VTRPTVPNPFIRAFEVAIPVTGDDDLLPALQPPVVLGFPEEAERVLIPVTGADLSTPEGRQAHIIDLVGYVGLTVGGVWMIVQAFILRKKR
jgi:hypothetical protein